MEKVINVGVVGFGMVSRVFHCPIITSNPNFKLTKVVERNKEESKKKYPWIQVVKTFEELLADENIDLVIINIPNELHYEYAKKALIANKNIIVEKPFTVTSMEAEELIRLAKNQNKMISVFQNRRWDGDFLTVKNIVDNNLLGNLVEYEAHFDRFRNVIREGTWKEKNSVGTGLLYDVGSHLIDQALTLFGLPKNIWGDIRTQRDNGKIIDNFEVVLSYDDLKVTLKGGMLVREPIPHFILHGTEGSFVKYGLDSQEDALNNGVLPGDKGWGEDSVENWGTINTEIKGLHYRGKIETLKGCYEEYYKNIYEVLVLGKELIVKPEQARDTIKIIEMIKGMTNKKRGD